MVNAPAQGLYVSVNISLRALGANTSQHRKWEAIAALDIITEALIFFLSVNLVAKLNMKLKSKFMVVIAFSARLPYVYRFLFLSMHISSTRTVLSRLIPEHAIPLEFHFIFSVVLLSYILQNT